MKKYKVGVVLGRFQMLHKGHISLIDESLSLAEKTVVLIGSSDKKRTLDNPFSFEERKEMIKSIRPDVIVLPIYDLGVGNVYLWGDYLIKTLKDNNITPDLFIFGNEDKVDLWFRKEILSNITIKKVSRKLIDISATKLRESILNNDKKLFDLYVPNELNKYYDFIKKTLEEIQK